MEAMQACYELNDFLSLNTEESLGSTFQVGFSFEGFFSFPSAIIFHTFLLSFLALPIVSFGLTHRARNLWLR
jgi:hypothetical protein